MFATGKKVFIETSFFLAFIDRASPNYLKSQQIFEYIARESYLAYTSEIVLQQTFNRLEKDIGLTVALDFIQAILESNIHVCYISASEFVVAFKFFKAAKKAICPLTEVINTDLMMKNRLTHVLTFDRWNNLMGTAVSELIKS